MFLFLTNLSNIAFTDIHHSPWSNENITSKFLPGVGPTTHTSTSPPNLHEANQGSLKSNSPNTSRTHHGTRSHGINTISALPHTQVIWPDAGISIWNRQPSAGNTLPPVIVVVDQSQVAVTVDLRLRAPTIAEIPAHTTSRQNLAMPWANNHILRPAKQDCRVSLILSTVYLLQRIPHPALPYNRSCRREMGTNQFCLLVELLN